MPSTRFLLDLSAGGQLDWLPLIRRLELTEVIHFDFQQASDATVTALPISSITNKKVVLVESDQEIFVYPSGSPPGDDENDRFSLDAGGVLVLMGANAGTVSIKNSSGATARVRGIAAG